MSVDLNIKLSICRSVKTPCRKIQLGGLVIKANIADEAAAVILGILIDAAQEMGANEQLKENYRAIGDAAFKEDT